MKQPSIILLIGLLILLLGLSDCSSEQNKKTTEPTFRNLADSVAYVGMQTCKTCHLEIYNSYQQTGMGQSFGLATANKTAAKFGQHQSVYDRKNDLYYYPFFKDSIFFVLEYRLDGKDTSHSRLEQISYIIGSGHHTNSHFIQQNGYLYQAPITYYTQSQKWDLAPGFDKNNQRFERAIQSECLTCHNHYPTLATGAENKYRQIPLGIECERCHGAGALHVQEKRSGKTVATKQNIDYSIVNPKHLSIARQMDLCQRCHLQGIAVLHENKSFYDFKPSQKLSDVMNVYLPRFSDSDKRFIMASQADRLQLSNCFTVSKQLSCITCHNPHHDVHSTQKNNYNSSCISCHKPQSRQSRLFDCSDSPSHRAKFKDNCVRCHLPKSGSIDIPHVNITDHFISKNNTLASQKPTLEKDSLEKIANFLGLKSLLIEKPTNLEKARAYLALYDKFMASPSILDSVRYYLDRSKASAKQKHKSWIHYYFNTQDYTNLLALAKIPQQTQDPWTAYRIGEAAYKSRQIERAKPYYQKAVQGLPFNLPFQEKLGTTLAQLKEWEAAEKIFKFILNENKKSKVACANLGLLYAQQGKINLAFQYYNQALGLDPDYQTALSNKINLLLYLKRKKEAAPLLQHLLKKYPHLKNKYKNVKINS